MTDQTTQAPGTSTAADTLRRAAQRLDELTSAATPGPWGATDKSGRYGGIVGPAGPNTDLAEMEGYGGELVAESLRAPNAVLITTLQTSVAPMAAWLRRTADMTATGNGIPIGRGLWLAEALAVAQAILGETGEKP